MPRGDFLFDAEHKSGVLPLIFILLTNKQPWTRADAYFPALTSRLQALASSSTLGARWVRQRTDPRALPDYSELILLSGEQHEC